MGGRTLKGLPDPVDVAEVRWKPLVDDDADAGVPLPARLASVPSLGFVGRSSELTTIADTYKRVEGNGGCQVVLVSGEPGLGKTTLVAAAARWAHEQGSSVLFGHCEQDLATPYKLFAEALGHYVAHAPDGEIRALVASHGAELGRLVPALRRRAPELAPSAATDADAERYLLFAAVVETLADLSRERPVVLVLDDLQWADRSSLQLLVHLVSSVHPMRVLVIGTYRDAELTLTHPFAETLGVLHRHDGYTRIELVGFDDLGVLALMEAAAGHALDDPALALARSVYRETGGNPYFVTEILRHLSESGVLYVGNDGRWTADVEPEEVDLPDSVREVIGTRVGRLGPEAERVLSYAAVIGRDFDLDVLCTATDLSDDDVLDLLDAAAGAALVDELHDASGHFHFRHALIQHTLYEELGASRRARAHRKVATALETVYGDRIGDRIGELARHWSLAVRPVDLAKAIEVSRRAGDAALAALAPDDAVTHYAQTLELIAQDPSTEATVELDVRIGLGTAQRQSGDAAFRETLLGACRQAMSLDDTDRLVAAALANTRGWSSSIGQIDADRVAVLEQALDRTDASSPHRPLLLSTLCAELCWHPDVDRRRALADEAIGLVAADDDPTMIRVLNDVALPLCFPHDLPRSLERRRDAVRRAERLGDPVLMLFAAMWLSQAEGMHGAIDERDRWLAVTADLADQLAEPTLVWSRLLNSTVPAMTVGDHARVNELALQALESGTASGQPDAMSYFGIATKIVAWQTGTLGDLVPLIEETRSSMEQSSTAFDATLALAHVEGGRPDDAVPLLDAFVEPDFAVPIDHSWLTTNCDFAEAAAECGHVEAAAQLFARLEPFSAMTGCSGTSFNGPVTYTLGTLATVLGHHDRAAGLLDEAAAFAERFGARFVASRVALWQGRLASAVGDEAGAAAHLTRAVALAERGGYARVAVRAQAELAKPRSG
jgi:hypothetical protein